MRAARSQASHPKINPESTTQTAVSPIKQAIRRSLASRWLNLPWALLSSGRFSILTFHRFGAGRRSGVCSVDLDLLDAMLGSMRLRGCNFIDLQDAVQALRHGDPIPPRCVAATVDDGYADFQGGAAVFARHGCPVTVFITTGFLDGSTWMWWDQVEYCCLEARAGSYEIGGTTVVVPPREKEQARLRIAKGLWEYCKSIPDSDRIEFVRALADTTRVTLPKRPPPRYAPLTWDRARALETSGCRFAPHTVNHPILARTDDAQAEYEINESWRRLREEIDAPSPIFAYPNGLPGDFGERERRIIGAAGIEAAVTMTAGYVSREHRGRLFDLPRFGEPIDPVGAVLTVNGLGRVPRPFR